MRTKFLAMVLETEAKMRQYQIRAAIVVNMKNVVILRGKAGNIEFLWICGC
jgi:hypothetical protein